MCGATRKAFWFKLLCKKPMIPCNLFCDKFLMWWRYKYPSIQDAEDFIALGADRLGTSRIVKLAMQMEEQA